MNKKRMMAFVSSLSLLSVSLLPVNHAEARTPTLQEAYPITLLLADKKHELTYPSIAGNRLVFTARHHDAGDVFRVIESTIDQPSIKGKSVPTALTKESIRFGVATDAGVGYVSNRMGPVSAWLWLNSGDMHTSISNYLTYRGGLIPNHLNASPDARFWCFDASMQKIRHNEMLQEFSKTLHFELRGQMWRVYDSNFYRRKDAYRDNKTGTKNRFEHPFLFIFDRQSATLSMIPNAFNGTISADGQRIVFVREIDGNYDLWMQNMDGTELTRLTDTPNGEYEPAFSPDGSKLAFVSNRDADGSVRHTSLYVMELSSGKSIRITFSSRASDGGPAWADEHHLIFHSNRSEKEGKTVNDWRLWTVAF